MNENKKYKQLELTGNELDAFIERLVERLYNDIWSGISDGPGEDTVKGKLRESIIEALNEYADFQAND